MCLCFNTPDANNQVISRTQENLTAHWGVSAIWFKSVGQGTCLKAAGPQLQTTIEYPHNRATHYLGTYKNPGMSMLLYSYFCNLNQTELSPFIHQLLEWSNPGRTLRYWTASYQVFYLPFLNHSKGVWALNFRWIYQPILDVSPFYPVMIIIPGALKRCFLSKWICLEDFCNWREMGKLDYFFFRVRILRQFTEDFARSINEPFEKCIPLPNKLFGHTLVRVLHSLLRLCWIVMYCIGVS